MGDLFKSKKWQAALVGFVAVTIGHFNEALAPLAEQLMYLIMTFIGGQGLADLGKEKAKVEAGDPT